MRVLLDTQAWLWFVLGNPSLSSTARKLILDPDNEKLVSAASHWELAIKIGIGKYVLPQRFDDFVIHAIAGQGFTNLAVLPAHTAALCSMPFHHRDPFDRLLIAQSLVEKIPLISSDAVFDAYGIRRHW